MSANRPVVIEVLADFFLVVAVYLLNSIIAIIPVEEVWLGAAIVKDCYHFYFFAHSHLKI